MKTIGIFGDSIAWGKTDPETGGWANLLRKELEVNRHLYGVYNLSIDGDTTRSLLARFDDEIKRREIDTIIFAIGINDSIYRKTKDNVEVPIEEFKDNISKLIEKARQYSPHIIFIGLTSVDEAHSKPLSYSTTGKCYDNGIIQQYDAVLKQTVEEMSIPFIKVFDVLTTTNIVEGVHLNTDGHRKLYKIIKEEFMLHFVIPATEPESRIM